MEAYEVLVAVGAFLLLTCWTPALYLLWEKCEVELQLDEERNRAYANFLETVGRLEEWRTARPLLRPRQCAYYTGLVEEVIWAYIYAVSIGAAEDDPQYRAALLALLDAPPPKNSPPNPAALPRELFFMWYHEVIEE